MVLVQQVLSPAPSTETMATTVHRHAGPVLNQCFITDKANLGREGFPSRSLNTLSLSAFRQSLLYSGQHFTFPPNT